MFIDPATRVDEERMWAHLTELFKGDERRLQRVLRERATKLAGHEVPDWPGQEIEQGMNSGWS